MFKINASSLLCAPSIDTAFRWIMAAFTLSALLRMTNTTRTEVLDILLLCIAVPLCFSWLLVRSQHFRKKRAVVFIMGAIGPVDTFPLVKDKLITSIVTLIRRRGELDKSCYTKESVDVLVMARNLYLAGQTAGIIPSHDKWTDFIKNEMRFLEEIKDHAKSN